MSSRIPMLVVFLQKQNKEQGGKFAQRKQYSYQNDVNDTVVICLLLASNRFTPSSGVFIVNFKQLNSCWDDNDKNNNDNSHDENVD